MNKLELRMNNVSFTSTDEGLKVSGYVNKTNQWSQELGIRKKFVERILPGTFEKAINRGNEINFLAEHDNAKILSSTRNDSLHLHEDEQGLYMEATISPTSWGKDYHTLIKDGIIRSMSFGMQVIHDTWKKLPNGTYERSIDDLVLAEVSAVRNPAYVQSTIQARSIEIVEDVEIPAEVENENENREEANQMDIELRDKLASVLDEILIVLKENQSAKENVENAKEAVNETVDETQVKAEVIVDKIQEVVDKVADEVEDVIDSTKEAIKEAVEDVADKVEEKAPDLTEYYKKLLDF